MQDAVRLCDAQGAEFARALINYTSEEVDCVKVSEGAGMSMRESSATAGDGWGRLGARTLAGSGGGPLPSLTPHPTSPLTPLQGMSSKEIAAGLGYVGQEEVCHRANICLLLQAHDDSGARVWAWGEGGCAGGCCAGALMQACAGPPSPWRPVLRPTSTPYFPLPARRCRSRPLVTLRRPLALAHAPRHGRPALCCHCGGGGRGGGYGGGGPPA